MTYVIHQENTPSKAFHPNSPEYDYLKDQWALKWVTVFIFILYSSQKGQKYTTNYSNTSALSTSVINWMISILQHNRKYYEFLHTSPRKNLSQSWKAASTVVSTGCSCRGTGFSSQHSHEGHTCLSYSLRDSHLLGSCMHVVHKLMQGHTQKNILNSNKFINHLGERNCVIH